MILVKEIKAEETYSVRLEVLRKNIPLPYKFNGDFDKETFHLGVYKNSKLISVSSFMKVENEKFSGTQYQLRGMATLNTYQGLGSGKLMMQEAFRILKKRDVDFLWCNARVVAVDFYRKMGLEIEGEQFDIKYVGLHYQMVKKI